MVASRAAWGVWMLLGVAGAAPEDPVSPSIEGEEPESAAAADAPVPSDDLRAARRSRVAAAEADGLYVEFGRGVRLLSDDGAFTLTMRGRIQSRVDLDHRTEPETQTDLSLRIRRARLVFLGGLVDRDIEFYLQVGLGSDDLDPEGIVPLRDAVVTWTALRDLHVRVGQMKVNFNRERMISSSSLQLVDRSQVNAELSLDRDVGVQVFSNDFLGLGERLGYQLGAYGGAGRNRIRQGTGLLYAARVWVNPFGEFDDLFFEADLARSPKPRLSIGLAAGLNQGAIRERSTHGSTLTTQADTRHAAADMLFKILGLSIQAEALVREARRLEDSPDGPIPLSAMGAMVQAGFVLPIDLELSGRWSRVTPIGLDQGAPGRTIVTGGVGWYVERHDLKLQGDYALGWGELGVAQHDRPDHLARVQLQLFF